MTDVEHVAYRAIESAVVSPPKMSWIRARAQQRRRRRRVALWGTMALPLLVFAGVAWNLADQSSGQKVVVGGPTEESIPVTTVPKSTDSSEVAPEEAVDYRTVGLQVLPDWANPPDNVPFFWVPGDASEVVQAYLRDRLAVEVGSISDWASFELPLDLVVQEEEIATKTAIFSYYSPVESGNDVEGYVYLRFGDGKWGVVAATASGLQLADLKVGSQGLHGTVTSYSRHQIYVDVTDQEGNLMPMVDQPVFELANGQRVGGAAGPQQGSVELSIFTGPQAVIVRAYLAGDSQLYGLTELAIPQRDLSLATHLEMYVDPTADLESFTVILTASDLVADYRILFGGEIQRRLDLLERSGAFEGIDLDSGQILFVLVALEATADVNEAAAFLLKLPGSLGVDVYEAETVVAREFDPNLLIVDTIEVTKAPVAVRCDAPLGRQVPLNVVHPVERLQVEPTGSAALSRFLADAEEAPLFDRGYIEFVEPDGHITYGFSQFENYLVVVISLESTDEGWRVVEWETPGC